MRRNRRGFPIPETMFETERCEQASLVLSGQKQGADGPTAVPDLPEPQGGTSPQAPASTMFRKAPVMIWNLHPSISGLS